jgi:hypothetical protein
MPDHSNHGRQIHELDEPELGHDTQPGNGSLRVVLGLESITIFFFILVKTMPQIYTKDEVENAFAVIAGQLESMQNAIQTEHNENFSNYRMCINQFNDLDQKAKIKKDNGTVSPYAR